MSHLESESEIIDLRIKEKLRDPRDPLPVGAIISRRLAPPLCLYQHFGVYLGSGKVVHFNGTKLGDRGAVLKLDTLESFASGQLVRIERLPNSPEHAQRICQRALESAQNPNNAWNGKYSFLTRNCESFVDYCYGKDTEGKRGSLPGPVKRTADAMAVGAVALSFALRRSSLPVALGTFAATVAFQWYRSSWSSSAKLGEPCE